jgi:GNAT superfamily N-acetyltransferase/predicted nucleic acid-binding protein
MRTFSYMGLPTCSAIEVQRLTFPSLLLGRVMSLHRLHSKTLGYLPVGAFEENAKGGRILVALTQNSLLGYLLYRVARGRAAIVHLCVSKEARGRGVARLLVERLKNDTKSLEGIGLFCRRDYDINHIWSKFGFEAVSSKAGRGRDGEELTFWWFGHGHEDLFSRVSESDPARQRVVIDANVFYDIHTRDTLESEDSKSLLADWVQTSIELVITKEMRNEIDKGADEELRRSCRAEATRYITLPADDALFQQLCGELRPHFPEAVTLRDEADLRQVAYSIAGGAPFLVTRDQTLIERAEPLYRRHGLKVLHPAELINHLDSIEREADYKPARIEGSRLRSELLKADALSRVVEAFKLPEERINDFNKELWHLLSHPRSLVTQLVSDAAERMVLVGAMDRSDPSRLHVPVLRRTDHPLSSTMLRNYLRTCLDSAAKEGRNLVTIHCRGLSRADGQVLREFGFLFCGEMAVKFSLQGIWGVTEVARFVDAIQAGQEFSSAKAAIGDSIRELGDSPDVAAASAIERQLWPAKIARSSIPTYIVSIRPEWAQHFFDTELGSQLLFGLRDDLHLGVEGVYYRSAENNNLTVPGRVLWYVSKGDGEGSMSVKACSQLEEVVEGKPKDLFRRFQRLGIYEWKDVYSAAKNEIANDISVFRFRMTERFRTPVDKKALAALGLLGPFMSPRKISDAQFEAIFRMGNNFGP